MGPVGSLQEVDGSASLVSIGLRVKIGQFLIYMVPDQFIALTELSIEAPLEDHVESENKSQTS